MWFSGMVVNYSCCSRYACCVDKVLHFVYTAASDLHLCLHKALRHIHIHWSYEDTTEDFNILET